MHYLKVIIKTIAFLLNFLFLFNVVNAQCTYSPPISGTRDEPTATLNRILYVNNFFKPGSNGLPDPNFSILNVGVFNASLNAYSKEIDLVNYAVTNGFTSLILYDIQRVLDPNLIPGYSNELKRFIEYAKTNGILEVGCALSSSKQAREISTFHGDPNTSEGCWDVSDDPEPIDIARKLTSMNIELDEQNRTVDNYGDVLQTIMEIYNYHLSILKNNPENASQICLQQFDRLVIEYEFWNPDPNGNGVIPYDQSWNYFKSLSYYMHCVNIRSLCEVKRDAYIGRLAINGITNYSEQVKADFIDLTFNRVLLADYWCDPDNLLIGTFRNMIDNFSNTNLRAEYVPLFSSVHSIFNNGIISWDDNLGAYLNSPFGGNFASCENKFFGLYSNYTFPFNYIPITEYAWFTYSVMFDHNLTRKAFPKAELVKQSDFEISNLIIKSPLVSNFIHYKFQSILNNHNLFILIFSIDGKQVYKKTISDQEFSGAIDISQFNNGIYYFQILSDLNYNETQTAKIVIIH